MQNTYLKKIVCTAIVAACLAGSLPVASAKNSAPAGQRCPSGTYVIGFDSETNIICSHTCGNGVVDQGETCDDGNRAGGDDCPSNCQSEVAKPRKRVEENTEKAIPAETVIPPDADSLVISDVTPSKQVFGTPELEITVSGTGFQPGTVILFDGKKYTPRVNQAGTRLEVTIPTGDLSIGPYTIKVSNGPGEEASLKRALEIF